jgi:hypothetical protein
MRDGWGDSLKTVVLNITFCVISKPGEGYSFRVLFAYGPQQLSKPPATG